MPETFRVGLTRDFLKADGTLAFGNIGLDLLDRAPGITREFLESHSLELQPEQSRRRFEAIASLPRSSPTPSGSTSVSTSAFVTFRTCLLNAAFLSVMRQFVNGAPRSVLPSPVGSVGAEHDLATNGTSTRRC